MSEDERPLVRHAERFRLTRAGAPQTIEGAGAILRVGSKEGNSLRLSNETVSRYHFEIEPTPLGFLLARSRLDQRHLRRRLPRARDLPAARARRSRRARWRCTFEALGEEVPIELSREDRFGDALGRSPAMRELFAHARAGRAQGSDRSCSRARAAPARSAWPRRSTCSSPRAHERFVVFDCARCRRR